MHCCRALTLALARLSCFKIQHHSRGRRQDTDCDGLECGVTYGIDLECRVRDNVLRQADMRSLFCCEDR